MDWRVGMVKAKVVDGTLAIEGEIVSESAGAGDIMMETLAVLAIWSASCLIRAAGMPQISAAHSAFFGWPSKVPST
jgi:hypothetical protein